MKSQFMYLAPHLVGNLENYGYCYDTDNEMFSTLKAAQKHGLKTLEHDDFWIAEMQNGKCVALYDSDLEKRLDNKDEITDVNKELALD